jgi:arylamine N-acetyltransferase
MRSLGYNVRNGGSRVSRMMYPDAITREQQSATYDPWDHVVNFVKFDNEWWLVDVEMASMGITSLASSCMIFANSTLLATCPCL